MAGDATEKRRERERERESERGGVNHGHLNHILLRIPVEIVVSRDMLGWIFVIEVSVSVNVTTPPLFAPKGFRSLVSATMSSIF